MGQGQNSYARRVLEVVRKNPREITERIRGRAEIKLSRLRPRIAHYDPTADWERTLHESMDAAWPCPSRNGFDEIWAEVSTGAGHDADVGLARAAWCATIHLRPEHAVETGVARGVTTKVILSALEKNNHGHLYSIDLPPIFRGWEAQAAELVDDDLKNRWTYLRGSSRRRLPRLLSDLGAIDLFLHDSLHTRSTMIFEISRAWERLRPGGILLVDDVHDNDAFATFVSKAQGLQLSAVGQKEVRGGAFAFALKKR